MRFDAPIPPIEPTRRALARNARALRAAGGAVRWFLRRRFDRVEISGREHLVGDGPLLVLANHCHVLDPVLLTAYAGRPLQFLITEPAMFAGPAARFLAWFGQVPKRKLDSDPRS